jgi:hypothetical protein
LLKCSARLITNSDVKQLARDVFYDSLFTKYTIKYFEHFDNIDYLKNKTEILQLSEYDLDNWVANNLHKTKFSSFNEYNNSKLTVNRYNEDFVANFSSRLEGFRKYSNFTEEFQNELENIVNEEDRHENSATNNCLEAGSRCIKRAQTNAAAQLAAAVVSGFFNPAVGVAVALVAKVLLSNALEACHDAFLACMENQIN